MLRVAALCLTLGLPTQAVALDCGTGGGLYAFPPNGTEDVPTNVVVRVVSGWDDPTLGTLVLEDGSGSLVETTRTRVTADYATTNVWTVKPVEALARLSTYRLRAGKDPQRPSFLSTFTTGGSADHYRPKAPVVLDVHLARDPSNKDSVELPVGFGGGSFSHTIWVAPPSEPLFYEVDVASSPRFWNARTVQAIGVPAGDRHSVRVGTGLCGGNLKLESDERHVRIGAIDMAGNKSAKSIEGRVGGCSWLAASGGVLAVLLGLLALAIRR